MGLIAVVAGVCSPRSVASVVLIVVRVLPIFWSELCTIPVDGWRQLVIFDEGVDASAALR